MQKKNKLPEIQGRQKMLADIDKARANLPALLNTRANSLEKELRRSEKEDNIPSLKAMDSIRFSRLAFHPIIKTYNEVQYSPQELAVLFDTFMNMSVVLNEKFGFIPQIGHFTRFIDVSESKFKYWKNNGSAEMQEACSKIIDELSTLTGDAMLQKKIGDVSGIFIEKTRYDRRDNAEVPKQTIQAQNVVITDAQMLSLIKDVNKISKNIGEQ